MQIFLKNKSAVCVVYTRLWTRAISGNYLTSKQSDWIKAWTSQKGWWYKAVHSKMPNISKQTPLYIWK